MLGRIGMRRLAASLGNCSKFQAPESAIAQPKIQRNLFVQISNRSLQTTSQLRFASDEKPDIKTRIEGLIGKSDVVVFMKGVPEAPRCGFSNAVCQILRMHDVPFESHDVLSDEEVRQGIKEFSNWPTIPQVFFKGEFVGGCDILLQMHQSGDLIEELQKIGITSALLTAEPESKDK